MLRGRESLRIAVSMVAVGALMAVAGGCGGASGRDEAAIARVIRISLADFLGRHSAAFCSDFTRASAAQMGAGLTCTSRVERTLTAGDEAIGYYGPRELPSGLRITDVREQAGRASATTTWPWPDIGRPVRVRLETAGGRWLLATPASVVLRKVCRRLVAESICTHFAAAEFKEQRSTSARWDDR
jgi:hypothetical protein